MAIIVVVRSEPVLKEYFAEGYTACPITDGTTGQQILHITAEDGRGIAEFKEWAYYRIT